MKTLSTAVLISLLLLTTNVWADTIRVKFPPGQASVSLKGKTTGGPSESGGMNPVTYKVRAKKGQQMTLSLVSAKKNAVFGVYLPGGAEPLEGGQNLKDGTFTLPKSGDYEIIVFPEDELTNTTFTITIAIK